MDIQNALFFGEEARDFLEMNVIQGTRTDNGRVRFKPRREHAINSEQAINVENANKVGGSCG